MTTVPLSQSTAQYWAMYAKRVRAAVLSAKQVVRLSEAGLAIEAKSLNTGQWQPIMLPNTGTQFASPEDRQLPLNNRRAPAMPGLMLALQFLGALDFGICEINLDSTVTGFL